MELRVNAIPIRNSKNQPYTQSFTEPKRDSLRAGDSVDQAIRKKSHSILFLPAKILYRMVDNLGQRAIVRQCIL